MRGARSGGLGQQCYREALSALLSRHHASGANKGAVVDALARRFGIPATEIATIGDMPNDVLMFRRSGLSVAMGNASDEVKAQASVVTESYNNEGFAKAVERYVLKGLAS